MALTYLNPQSLRSINIFSRIIRPGVDCEMERLLEINQSHQRNLKTATQTDRWFLDLCGCLCERNLGPSVAYLAGPEATCFCGITEAAWDAQGQIGNRQ